MDHDTHSTVNCAEGVGSGGWWFTNCSPVSMTGSYLKPGEYLYKTGIFWRDFEKWGHGYKLFGLKKSLIN